MKLFKCFIVVVVLFLLPSLCWGSVGAKNQDASIGTATDINFESDITASSDGSKVSVVVSPIVVKAATPDSITVSQGGTTFIATSKAAFGRRFWLPAITSADNNLSYKFVGGESSTNIVANRSIQVNLGDANSSIFYTSKGTSLQGIQALEGDIGADSYPTIELRAYDGDWYVVNAKGTWALYTQ